jgi:hypothetical protein
MFGSSSQAYLAVLFLILSALFLATVNVLHFIKRRKCTCAPICLSANEQGWLVNDTFFTHSGCQYHWYDRAEVVNALKGRWLMFIGDSDTRGLVLALLQHLDTDQLLPFSAKRWWNISTETGDPTRVRYLDWSIKSVSQEAGRFNIHKVTGLFVDRCDMRSRALSKHELRISYCMATTMRNFTQTLHNFITRAAVLPNMTYINTGAWRQDDVDPQDITRVLPAMQSSGHMFIWGTSLAHRRNNVDGEIIPQLEQKGIRYLNRSLISHMLLNELHTVQLSNGHVPHMINMYDSQRLLNMFELKTGCFCQPYLTFTPTCKADTKPSQAVFIQAWQQVCMTKATYRGR